MTKEDILRKLKSTFPPNLVSHQSLDRFAGLLDDIQASPESYLTWLLETHGNQAFRQKLLSAVPTYNEAAIKSQQQLPQEIVNAGEIFNKLSENALDSQQVTEVLQEMCPQYALYFLFGSVGINIPQFEESARKFLLKFPNAIDKLPEDFKKLGRRLLVDSTQ